uniref:Uncharacterized protein n=1 Tax=Parascaris univalens TaxID=6257 RepID=A0A915B513_PARUN
VTETSQHLVAAVWISSSEDWFTMLIPQSHILEHLCAVIIFHLAVCSWDRIFIGWERISVLDIYPRVFDHRNAVRCHRIAEEDHHFLKFRRSGQFHILQQRH